MRRSQAAPTRGDDLRILRVKKRRTTKTPVRVRKIKKSPRRPKHDLEEDMLSQMRDAELPEPTREYRFHSKRRWRFDFAWLDQQVALEVDGGTYMRMATGHTSPSGYRAGCEKSNEAQLLGWLILRVDSKMVKDGSALRYVERALRDRKAA